MKMNDVTYSPSTQFSTSFQLIVHHFMICSHKKTSQTKQQQPHCHNLVPLPSARQTVSLTNNTFTFLLYHTQQQKNNIVQRAEETTQDQVFLCLLCGIRRCLSAALALPGKWKGRCDITMLFLGYRSRKEEEEVIELIREAVSVLPKCTIRHLCGEGETDTVLCSGLIVCSVSSSFVDHSQ